MYWLIAGLLVLGAACGAMVRLVIFIGVLVVAAVIVIVGSISHGLGAAAINALIVLVSLQVGYAGGFVCRAAIRAYSTRTTARPRDGQPVTAPLGEKRR
jgi:hypothetical protein